MKEIKQKMPRNFAIKVKMKTLPISEDQEGRARDWKKIKENSKDALVIVLQSVCIECLLIIGSNSMKEVSYHSNP